MALLTATFLPEPDAFFLATAFFPLVVAPFFANRGWAESESKSESGSSTSIAIESTDSASSSSAPARALALPLMPNEISIVTTSDTAGRSRTFALPVFPDLCSSTYCFSRSSRTLSSWSFQVSYGLHHTCIYSPRRPRSPRVLRHSPGRLS